MPNKGIKKAAAASKGRSTARGKSVAAKAGARAATASAGRSVTRGKSTTARKR